MNLQRSAVQVRIDSAALLSAFWCWPIGLGGHSPRNRRIDSRWAQNKPFGDFGQKSRSCGEQLAVKIGYARKPSSPSVRSSPHRDAAQVP